MKQLAFAVLALCAAAPLSAGPAEDSFAVYQSCFDKAAVPLFASGTSKAGKLEKAARKACKAERDQAIIDERVRVMLDPQLVRTLLYPEMVRALDRAAATPTMRRLGFEGY